MKMVMIVYNEATDQEVMEALDHCGLKHYTKIKGVLGRGELSGTHLGNDVWPGKNNLLFVACPIECVSHLLGCIGELRSRLGHEGIKAFAWPLDEVT